MSRRLKWKLKALGLVVLVQKLLENFGIEQLPPKYLRRLVGGRVETEDFVRGGELWLERLINEAGLSKDSRVLDIGCGCGAAAIPLRIFLDKQGRYEGFDVFGELVYWCKRMIEEKDSRFVFRVSDVYNKQYNRGGKEEGKDYRFMYPDEYFDVIIAGSVFTHLLEQDMRQYLKESVRVLKSGGHLWASYFLWRDESREAAKKGQSTFSFGKEMSGRSRVEDEKMPEMAVAYDEKKLMQRYGEAGLKVAKVSYGTWVKGVMDVMNFQDVVVAKK